MSLNNDRWSIQLWPHIGKGSWSVKRNLAFPKNYETMLAEERHVPPDCGEVIYLQHSPSFLSPCSSSLLQQVVCLSVDGLRQSFGVAMAVPATWWVEYSGHSNRQSPHGAAVSIFSFTDRRIFGIAPITEVINLLFHLFRTNPKIIIFIISQTLKAFIIWFV